MARWTQGGHLHVGAWRVDIVDDFLGQMEKHQMFAKEAVANAKAEIGMHQLSLSARCLEPGRVQIV